MLPGDAIKLTLVGKKSKLQFEVTEKPLFYDLLQYLMINFYIHTNTNPNPNPNPNPAY